MWARPTGADRGPTTQDLFADGAVVVTLANVAGPEQLIPAIAAALGLPEPRQTPTPEWLVTRLRHKHMLLVLDNFEHLVEAAPALGQVLSGCGQLRMLVTSTLPLRLRRTSADGNAAGRCRSRGALHRPCPRHGRGRRVR
ncbi:MAG: hypothetical protein R2854_08050 [Caldilineaceae bacterium]